MTERESDSERERERERERVRVRVRERAMGVTPLVTGKSLLSNQPINPVTHRRS